MVCKTTSSAERRSQAGFTLAESLVAAALGVLILGAACVLWGFANETFAGTLNYVDLAASSKNALDRMTQQIRNAQTVTSCTAYELKLLDLDGNEFKFTYNPTTKVLTTTQAGTTTTLLKGCTALSFSLFQRTPSSGSYDLVGTSATNTAKVVQIRWNCSRFLVGARQNTERQVSAKIVIRNR